MKKAAFIKYLRISPKKLKGLARAVIELPAKAAIDRLQLLPGKGGRLLASVIKSAVANLSNNQKLDSSSLQIKAISILKGPSFSRWQPVSRGMAHPIKKKTSHIQIELAEIKSLKSPSKKESVKTETVIATQKTTTKEAENVKVLKDERSQSGTKS